MTDDKSLINCIVEGIQEKKGIGIRVVDLTDIDDTICKYMVICEGHSPTQVLAISDSVEDYVRENAGEKPLFIDGRQNGLWVAMDYFDVVVHVFVPESRDFYRLDDLWADAKVSEIEDVE